MHSLFATSGCADGCAHGIPRCLHTSSAYHAVHNAPAGAVSVQEQMDPPRAVSPSCRTCSCSEGTNGLSLADSQKRMLGGWGYQEGSMSAIELEENSKNARCAGLTESSSALHWGLSSTSPRLLSKTALQMTKLKRKGSSGKTEEHLDGRRSMFYQSRSSTLCVSVRN